jgi:hypothetical protein
MLDAGVPIPAASDLMPMLSYAIGTTLKNIHLVTLSLKLGEMCNCFLALQWCSKPKVRSPIVKEKWQFPGLKNLVLTAC